MRKILAALLITVGTSMSAAAADVRVSIGINVPAYPVLQRIPNYPVYYAPSLPANYFFYDGLYWVFDGQEWYASSWYDGPWHFVDRYSVPVYLLRVPVRYYRHAPATFHAWSASAAPHWGVYWGSTWATRRAGWDRWDQRSAPAPAPLPAYQRAYTGDRYPRGEQQTVIQSRNYRYQPKDQVARQVTERRVLAEARNAPGQIRDERGMPEHAQGKAKGRDRDERGMPEHSQGKAKGHDRDERGMPEHSQGKGKGRDKD